MRWNLALSTMEKYNTLAEDDVLDFTEGWVQKVKKCVQNSAPYLRLLDVCEGLEESNMVGNINTIISIGIKVKQKERKECLLEDSSYGISYRQLTYDEMKVFHLKMATEVILPTSYVSPVTPSTSASTSTPKLCGSLNAESVRTILATKILLGQPVKLADSVDGVKIASVVRIALGATMVIAAVGGDCPYVRSEEAKMIELEDVLVVQKMALLAMHWDELAVTVPSHSSPTLPLSLTRTPTPFNTATQEPEPEQKPEEQELHLHGMTHH